MAIKNRKFCVLKAHRSIKKEKTSKHISQASHLKFNALKCEIKKGRYESKNTLQIISHRKCI